MELRKVAENATTLTLAWVAIPTAQVFAFYSDGELRSTGSKNYTSGANAGQPRTEVRFSKVGEPYEVAALLRDANGAFGVDSGSYSEAPPLPGPGDDIVLVNQTWSPPASNWGAKGLVDVRINQVEPSKDGAHLSGSGTVGKLFIETHSADGVKVHADAAGIVLGSYDQDSVIRTVETAPGAHQDNIQAMGGGPVTFRGVRVEKLVPGNAGFFANMGSGGNSLPTDVVCEFCEFIGWWGDASHGGGIPVKIYNSLRCGIRHSLIVYATTPGRPLDVSAGATNPVVGDSYAMTHAQWDAAGKPLHRDLWNANGSHKPRLDQLIASGDAELLTA